MFPRVRRKSPGHGPAPRQQGIVIVIFSIAMLTILATVGLAIDSSHALMNKTRLQNAVDSAALSGAKTLDAADDTVLARADAIATFAQNASAAGNTELGTSYGSGDITVNVQFSSTLNPFVPGTIPADYVRVIATGYRLPTWFTRVTGRVEKNIGATAVAGPSPTIGYACNIAPMMVCGDPSNPAGTYFGYTMYEPDVLKTSTTQGNFEVGPGNFQLIRLGGGQGGAVVREAMAGNYDGCVGVNDSIPTEPGNTVGPVVQGLNTRFGEYAGPMRSMQDLYPPDVVVEQPATPLEYDPETDTILYNDVPVAPPYAFYDYDSYAAQVGAGPASYDYQPIEDGGSGAFGRRTMALPIGDCSVATNGQGDIPLLGFACYHLLQEAQQQGNLSHVYGQFIGDGCAVTGRPGPTPGSGPGPYIIQLYKDPDSTAS